MKIIIKENKSKESIGQVKYFLSYQTSDCDESKRKGSFEVLSKLICNFDLLIEIKNSLLNVAESVREKYISDLLIRIKEIGLDYRYKKVIIKKNSLIFNIFNFGNRTDEVSELLIFVPNNIWLTKELYKILPVYGVIYYFINNGEEGLKLMEDIHRGHITETDYFDHFKYVIYDCAHFWQMGINTKDVSINDIKSKLGLNK